MKNSMKIKFKICMVKDEQNHFKKHRTNPQLFSAVLHACFYLFCAGMTILHDYFGRPPPSSTAIFRKTKQFNSLIDKQLLNATNHHDSSKNCFEGDYLLLNKIFKHESAY